MSAFISHSSKDKPFVRQVTDALGSLDVELDESTFEFVLNVQAIRQALKRSSIVVFFVSKNSISSSFVAEEQRQTLEALGRGSIKKVVIFSIDQTSYTALPEWMREINIVQRASNPKICARKIQSILVEIDASSLADPVYIGRQEEEASLRKALAVPKRQSPISVHTVGFHGVGRRTFLRKSLNRIFPRYYESFIEISATRYQGVEDLYRSLYGLQIISSRQDMVRDFENFSNLNSENQIEIVHNLIMEVAADGTMLIVNDDFGVLDEEGHYQDYWELILKKLENSDRPAIGFIQSRMQPYRIRVDHPRCFYIRINELSDKDSRELIALSLREADVDFDENQLKQLADLVDGHPFNLRFVVGYANHYGLENFLQDPRDFIEWKNRRGEDFLAKIPFQVEEVNIVSALAEYRYLSAHLLLSITSLSPAILMERIRALQDYCCVEFHNGYFRLSSPIREAIRRDARFFHEDAWYEAVAQAICDAATDYLEEDDMPVSIVEAATFAQARGATAPAYLRSLVLPSHLLMIARDHYDRHLRPQCIEFCKRTFEMRGRMSSDAQVETLRLWGLSAARSNEAGEFAFVISALKEFTYPTAKRVRLFLEGFFARLKGQPEIAERRFKDAWNLAPRNSHINRELASLYCKQRRFEEAEQHARSSYEIQKTNPYIIDILLETLIGKKSIGQHVDVREISRLRDELRTQSIESDTLFYNMREAQDKISERDYGGAATEIEDAIKINDSVPSIYFLGIEAEIGRSNLAGAERYLDKVRYLLTRQGQSEGDECRLIEAEVSLLIERKGYSNARSIIEKGVNLPETFNARISAVLAKAILFDSQNAGPELISWANRVKG